MEAVATVVDSNPRSDGSYIEEINNVSRFVHFMMMMMIIIP